MSSTLKLVQQCAVCGTSKGKLYCYAVPLSWIRQAILFAGKFDLFELNASYFAHKLCLRKAVIEAVKIYERS